MSDLGFTVSGLYALAGGGIPEVQVAFGYPDLFDARLAEDLAREDAKVGKDNSGVDATFLCCGVLVGGHENQYNIQPSQLQPADDLFTVVGCEIATFTRWRDTAVADYPKQAALAIINRARAEGAVLRVSGVFLGDIEVADRYALFADNPDAEDGRGAPEALFVREHPDWIPMGVDIAHRVFYGWMDDARSRRIYGWSDTGEPLDSRGQPIR